jgi:hypothetical protein
MARGLISLWLIAALLLSAQERRRAPSSEVEVLGFRAERSVSRIHLDGTVRNTGSAAIDKPLMIFYFVSPDKKVVATRNAPLEVKRLEPGEDAQFMLETAYPVRASEIRLEAFDSHDRFIKMTNAGPYPIE